MIGFIDRVNWFRVGIIGGMLIIAFCIGAIFGQSAEQGKATAISNGPIQPTTEYSEQVMAITERYLRGEIDSHDAAESIRETLISCGVIDENGDLKTVDLDKIDPIYRNGKVNSTDKDVAKACRSLMIDLEWRASGRGTVSVIEYEYSTLILCQTASSPP